MSDQKIMEIEYFLEDGTLVFSEPMIFRRLWAVGDDLVHEYRSYAVLSVEIEDNKQIVTIRQR